MPEIALKQIPTEIATAPDIMITGPKGMPY